MEAKDHNDQNGYWTCWSHKKLMEGRAVVHLQGIEGKTLCGTKTHPYNWDFNIIDKFRDGGCKKCMAILQKSQPKMTA